MPDTQAPVLTGLTLPSTISLASGDATITYSAAASDDTGVASVWITFDRQITGIAGPTATWLMREEFGEDFLAGPISRDLVVSRFNTAGAVTITNVTVYDDAGNAASYDTADLNALGLPTGFTMTDTTPDAGPPTLTGLSLPGTIDITDGPVTASYTVSAEDDTAVDGVWLTFERPASGTNPAANRWFVYEAPGEDWSTGALTRSIDIREDTAPGAVTLFSVTVYDVTGNASVYARPQLEALGLPLGFTVANDAIPPDFSLSAEITSDGLAFSLLREGDALVAPLIGLVLRLDAPGAGAPSAALSIAGGLTQDIDPEGDAQVLRVQADVSATLGTSMELLEVSLPTGAAQAVSAEVLGIEVDGVLAFVPALPPLFAGTAGDDALTVAGAAGTLVLGGAGQDTLRGGAGDDTLTGGTGNDVFAATSGGGTDRITDFVQGSDLLDLSAFDEAAALHALESAGAAPEGTRVTLPDGSDLLLDGILAGALGIDDTTFEEEPPPPDTVLEVHRLRLSGAEQVVPLAHTFTNPVAIARAPSSDDPTPVAVRIWEVTATSVRLSLQRPDYLTGQHPEEEVTLVVAEAGANLIGSGTVLQAGLIETGRKPQSASYNVPYDARPALLTQAQTGNDPDFVVTRVQATDETGFEVFLQEEQSAPQPFKREAETVGWIAVTTGTDTLDLGTILAGNTGLAVTDTPYLSVFDDEFASPPLLAASLSTTEGGDPAMLRLQNIGAASFEVALQEEQSADQETSHVPERVDFLAFSSDGTTQGSAIPIATGQVRIGEVQAIRASDKEKTILLEAEYENPVIFVQPASFAGKDPGAIRIVEVTESSVTLFFQEPEVENGGHAKESASLLVMEAGRHRLADGTIIEVGTLETKKLSSAGFAAVTFAEDFDAQPAIVSQVQTTEGKAFVVTRQDAASPSGFRVTMQEQEASNAGGHAKETIGWMAIEHGSGTWSGLRFEAGSTGSAVDHTGQLHDFAAPFETPPNLVAAISSYAGKDPAMLRSLQTTPEGFKVFVQEEQSLDQEIRHVPERVDYLVIEGTGPLDGVAAEQDAGSGSGGTVAGTGLDLWM